MSCVLAVLSACSGSRSGVTPAPHSTAAGAAILKGRVLVTIPHGGGTTTAGRRPAYISAATQSATLNVTPEGSSTLVSGYPETPDTDLNRVQLDPRQHAVRHPD